MPRLVFIPTASKLAATAPGTPRADRGAGRRERPRRGFRARQKVRGFHIVATGENVDVAGLGRPGSPRGRPLGKLRRSPLAEIKRPSRPRAAARPWRASSRDASSSAMEKSVTLLQTLPAGHGIDFDHVPAAIGRAQQIDAGEFRLDRRRRPQSEIAHFVVRLAPGSGLAPSFTLVIQCGAPPRHGGQHAPTRHQHAAVGEAVALRHQYSAADNRPPAMLAISGRSDFLPDQT